jgi:hypothetical protein
MLNFQGRSSLGHHLKIEHCTLNIEYYQENLPR